MQWTDLVGHQQQRDWFSAALSRGRLASSFLFVGPEGVGKRTFARLLAKSLLCRATSARQLDFCGGCEDCVQVDAHTHPDLIEIAKPPEKARCRSINWSVGKTPECARGCAMRFICVPFTVGAEWLLWTMRILSVGMEPIRS